jgi:hypothetical protein
VDENYDGRQPKHKLILQMLHIYFHLENGYRIFLSEMLAMFCKSTWNYKLEDQHITPCVFFSQGDIYKMSPCTEVLIHPKVKYPIHPVCEALSGICGECNEAKKKHF